jgi:hypothetical protein
MTRICTEIRITHESKEVKEAYEKILDVTIKGLGYRNRTEWLNSMVRQSRIKYMEQKRLEESQC